ncbi:unnamed protein product, partial [Tilletia caries]
SSAPPTAHRLPWVGRGLQLLTKIEQKSKHKMYIHAQVLRRAH